MTLAFDADYPATVGGAISMRPHVGRIAIPVTDNTPSVRRPIPAARARMMHAPHVAIASDGGHFSLTVYWLFWTFVGLAVAAVVAFAVVYGFGFETLALLPAALVALASIAAVCWLERAARESHKR